MHLRFNLSIVEYSVLHIIKFEHVFQCFVIRMCAFLYLYDFRKARQSNARRVSFTKELYGFLYSWKTKSGVKQKRKPGIIEECPGTEAVADSAILVPLDHKGIFDMLFEEYSDIMDIRIFEVFKEVGLANV